MDHRNRVTSDVWPSLPLHEWQDTLATVHRWLQIVGKTRLALAPIENHWWHVVQYVTARGLTTSPMPVGDRVLEVAIDFIDHRLEARTSDGSTRELPLRPMSVAEFYRRYREILRSLDVDVRIRPVPSEMGDDTPFHEDEGHASYDREAVERYWYGLLQVDRVMKEFRGSFIGKCSPVHFWWGGFDLACTRFSGRRAPMHPGGIPGIPDRVTREAYSHECISAGFWPGSPDAPVREPIFYAYAYPEPPGCVDAPIRPVPAGYHAALREWTLPYDVVRQSPNPDAMLLEFLQCTYETAAELGAWNRVELERPPSH